MNVTFHRIDELQWLIKFRLTAGPGREIDGEFDIETDPGREMTQDIAEAIVRRYRDVAIRAFMQEERKGRARPARASAPKVQALR
jgi:hypothetical protein